VYRRVRPASTNAPQACSLEFAYPHRNSAPRHSEQVNLRPRYTDCRLTNRGASLIFYSVFTTSRKILPRFRANSFTTWSDSLGHRAGKVHPVPSGPPSLPVLTCRFTSKLKILRLRLRPGTRARNHVASFHHPSNLMDHHIDVAQRIAFHRHQIRKVARSNGA
jgi:hypothetical protein